MSWRVAHECAERTFDRAARKQIVMLLAEKASDDGAQQASPPINGRCGMVAGVV